MLDKKNLINRVLLNIYTPTRRGIAMGIPNNYCSLYMVCPLSIVESTTNAGTSTVYEYKNPAASDSYLQFALDDKTNISNPLCYLDRPVK